jgi:hypothetical protein
MPRLPACLAVVLATAFALPAQGAPSNDGERRATFVRVEDGKGAPLAGATVTFAGHLPHLVGATGPTDVVRVQADGRGRAQGKLLPGLCYVAWAVGVPDAAGVAATSEPANWFAAGGVQTLRARGIATTRALRLDGLDAWRHVGPLRFAVVTPMPGAEEELALGADGALRIPPGPSPWIEVRTADGAPLWWTNARTEAATLPPPRRLRVLAKDEKGAPIAGADVRLRVWRRSAWTLDGGGTVVEDRWRALGKTGADGALAIEAPYAGDPLQDHKQGDLLLYVGAPGRPSVAGGVASNEFYVDDRKSEPIQGDTLPFTLRPAPTLAGSLGKVAPGTEVHLAAVCKLYLERSSYRHDARGYRAVVAADGTFAFDDVPAEVHALRLSVVPAGGQGLAPMFPTLRTRELPPEVSPDAHAPGKEPPFADIALRVTDARGGPARGLVVCLVPASQQGVFVRDSMVRVPLDVTGAAGLRLAPGKWVVVAVSADGGFCAEAFEWAAGRAEVALAMREMPRMRLQLKGVDGAPIADATVATRGTSTRGTNDPLQSALQQFRQFAYRQWHELRTDAEGRIELPFVPVDGVTVKLGLQWDGGRSEDLVLEATDDWVVVQPK